MAGSILEPRIASVRRSDIMNRLSQDIDLVTKMLTRDWIDHGNRRRDDKARRLTNRGRRSSGCLHDFFAEPNPRFSQGLAAIDAAADELDDFWIFGECPMI